jgi:hypothetical protein
MSRSGEPLSLPPLSAGSVPDPHDRHRSLWNSTGFYALNADARDRRVQVDHHEAGGRLVGSFVAVRVEDRLVSGFGAPMGGVDFVRADEVPRHVIDLLRTVVEHAAAEGAATVELRMKPPHHGPAEQHLLFSLLSVGAVVQQVDLSFYLDLSTARDAHRPLLQPRAEKAARRGTELGWDVRLLATDDEDGWAHAYAVLERNRVEKGRPMRLSLDYVRGIRDAFAPLVRMHVLRDGDGAVLAAALVYRTAERHDVVQYWGDQPGDHPVSPMPLLARGVFAAAAASGADVVDLGISTDQGRPNHGLIQFKRSIGAQTEVRMQLALDTAAVLAAPGWAPLRG